MTGSIRSAALLQVALPVLFGAFEPRRSPGAADLAVSGFVARNRTPPEHGMQGKPR